ncbi:hypothetical protein D9757_009438 [Collybiopsis confluens]|uniref:AB hydrolase-1 domain-containing protein n=1 Tax=Collybiopsis confluens TaxID=2823264 RepID=A0A8H5M570_9AGAR|nr:hypothetical protein D9757_009438 [Collybiopsis confluens]
MPEVYTQPKTYNLSGGIDLSFTDAGAPLSDDYTTVVILHGTAFNAYQLRKVHVYAHENNLRTVLLHQRHYAGSTPYTTDEIEDIKQGEMGFWERGSAQLAEFLNTFIKQERIPKLTTEGRGGIAIMGWSMGVVPVLSFLATAKNPIISIDLSECLQEYIGRCILYEPPFLAFGISPPPKCPNFNPWEEPDISPEDLPIVFSRWISSYFDHPCYDPVTKSLSISATIHDYDGRPEGPVNSISSWTADDISKGIENDAVDVETLKFMPSMQQTIQELTTQALFDNKNTQSCFPAVKVAHIFGTKTAWSIAWTENEMWKKYQTEPRQGREMQFVEIDGWNHFAHWDYPQQFMSVVADCIYSSA